MTDTEAVASEAAMAGGKKSAWMMHVKKTMRSNKGMKLAKVLKLASKSFKKTKRGGGALSPAAVGGRRRKSRKTRRGGMDGY
jgi:hypothetical protein